MDLATSVQRHAARRHQRLTVVAAALAVLCVLLLPAMAGRLLGLVTPTPPGPESELTPQAREFARARGAAVLGDTVVVTVTSGMGSPVTAASQRVLPAESAGYLVPLGVSGVVSMAPDVAPAAFSSLAAELTPGDKVLANLGPLVVGCLRLWHDPASECTPALLTRHATGYYRFPAGWGTSDFLEPGSAMQAEVFAVLGGRLVVGGLPGLDAALVEVRVRGGNVVTAFTTPSASPGDTIWWAVTTERVVRATAYDADGAVLARVDPE